MAPMPTTVTSSNNVNCIPSECDDDDGDHLAPIIIPTILTAAQASSHGGDEAHSMRIKQLFTKLLWGFHRPRSKWCIDMK